MGLAGLYSTYQGGKISASDSPLRPWLLLRLPPIVGPQLCLGHTDLFLLCLHRALCTCGPLQLGFPKTPSPSLYWPPPI